MLTQQATTELVFARRGKGFSDSTAEVMVWNSACRRYRVARRTSKYFRNVHGQPRIRFCAMLAVERYGMTCWDFVDPARGGQRGHRNRKAAEAACRRHAREEGRGGGKGRRGDRETGRRGDREKGRQGEGETGEIDS